MEAGLTGSVEQLLQLGLPGIIILALAWVSWKLFQRFDQVQEKRIAEGREVVEALNANTASLDALVELIKDRRPIA